MSRMKPKAHPRKSLIFVGSQEAKPDNHKEVSTNHYFNNISKRIDVKGKDSHVTSSYVACGRD